MYFSFNFNELKQHYSMTTLSLKHVKECSDLIWLSCTHESFQVRSYVIKH